MKKVTIQAEHGLHARPAATFVKMAQEIEGDVILKKGEKEASAKSLMKLMSLGILQGDEVEVHAPCAESEEKLATFLEEMQ